MTKTLEQGQISVADADSVRLCNKLANGPIIVSLPLSHWSNAPTLSTLYIFYASLQTGAVVGQGHWDNPLILFLMNDQALVIGQLPAPLFHSRSNRQTLAELSLRAPLDFISLLSL